MLRWVGGAGGPKGCGKGWRYACHVRLAGAQPLQPRPCIAHPYYSPTARKVQLAGGAWAATATYCMLPAVVVHPTYLCGIQTCIYRQMFVGHAWLRQAGRSIDTCVRACVTGAARWAGLGS